MQTNRAARSLQDRLQDRLQDHCKIDCKIISERFQVLRRDLAVILHDLAVSFPSSCKIAPFFRTGVLQWASVRLARDLIPNQNGKRNPALDVGPAAAAVVRCPSGPIRAVEGSAGPSHACHRQNSRAAIASQAGAPAINHNLCQSMHTTFLAVRRLSIRRSHAGQSSSQSACGLKHRIRIHADLQRDRPVSAAKSRTKAASLTRYVPGPNPGRAVRSAKSRRRGANGEGIRAALLVRAPRGE